MNNSLTSSAVARARQLKAFFEVKIAKKGFWEIKFCYPFFPSTLFFILFLTVGKTKEGYEINVQGIGKGVSLMWFHAWPIHDMAFV